MVTNGSLGVTDTDEVMPWKSRAVLERETAAQAGFKETEIKQDRFKM